MLAGQLAEALRCRVQLLVGEQHPREAEQRLGARRAVEAPALEQTVEKPDGPGPGVRLRGQLFGAGHADDPRELLERRLGVHGSG